MLLKAVLYPVEAGAASRVRLPGGLAGELAGKPRLGGVMEKLSRGEALECRDTLSLLMLEGEVELLCSAAEALAAAVGGREAVPAVVLDVSAGEIRGKQKVGERKGGEKDQER